MVGFQLGIAVLVLTALPAVTYFSIGPAARLSPAAPEPVAPALRTVRLAVERGQSLHAVLSNAGVPPGTALAIIQSMRPFVDVRKIRPGQRLEVMLDPRLEEIHGLKFFLGETAVHVESGPQGWQASRREIPYVRETKQVRGTLTRNLYQDGVAAGLTPPLILGLTDVFQYDVDFFSDFRRGDSFSVAFEEIRYEDGRRLPGRILVAELEVGGAPVHAIHYVDEKGEGGYYDLHGKSLKRAFLRAPLNYRRISSHFSHKRANPILRAVRPHLAVDYSAAEGTPVVSIGRGRVKFAGWRTGYGKLVEIQHPNGYTTRYAHFSRIARGIVPGKMVSQEEVVGYVGQTGHATGPHLHFEILKGQQKVNFLAMRMPSEKQLSGGEFYRFAAERDERLAFLRDGQVQLASILPSLR